MSVKFDGVDDYVWRGSVTLGNARTVTGWVSLDSFANSPIVVNQQDGGGPDIRWAFQVDPAGIVAYVTVAINGSYRSWTTPALAVNANWKFLALSWDTGGNIGVGAPVLYVAAPADGLAFSAPSLTVGGNLSHGTEKPDGASVIFGSRSGGAQPLNGRLGECAVWKRALSLEEIAAVYVNGVNAVPDHFDYLPFADPNPLYNYGSSKAGWTFQGPQASPINPPIRPAGRRG